MQAGHGPGALSITCPLKPHFHYQQKRIIMGNPFSLQEDGQLVMISWPGPRHSTFGTLGRVSLKG